MKWLMPMACVIITLFSGGGLVPTIAVSAAGSSPHATVVLDRLAWTELRDGQWDLYVGTVDGTERFQITNTPERELGPVWSPDGTRIAFSYGDVAGPGVGVSGRDLFVVGLDGTPAREIASGPVLRWVWSPAGDAILYSTAVTGQSCQFREINARVVGGSPAWSRTVSYPGALFPAWLPDGDLVALTFGPTPNDPGRVSRLSADGTRSEPLGAGMEIPPGGAPPVLPLGMPPTASYVAWLATRAEASEEWLAVSRADSASVPEPVLRLGAGPSFGFNLFRTVNTHYIGCKAPRDALVAWSQVGERLALIGLATATQQQPIDLRFAGILNEPPPGVRTTSTAEKPSSLDPLNLDVGAFEVVVMGVDRGGEAAIRIPYDVLLADYANEIAEIRAGDQYGLARERNLGIVNLAWSGDDTRLLYAVAKNRPRTADYEWRFFAYDPANGARAELFSQDQGVTRAYLACCGQSPATPK